MPVAKVVLGVEASTHREVGLCLDLFFSKWASSLDEFVPLLIPKRRCVEAGDRPHFELDPLVTPEEFVERFTVAYERYAERVDDLRKRLLQVRRSYRFNLLIPPSPSQLQAEDMLVEEIGLVEGSVRGINLILGLDEWERIEETSLIAWEGNSTLLDELSLEGYLRFGERSSLLTALIRSNPQLEEFLSSLPSQ